MGLALDDFKKAIQINSNDAIAYYNRGLLYQNQKKWELALSNFNKAIQINPNYASAYNNRGLTYLRKVDKRKAITDLQQAAQLFQAQGDTKSYEMIQDLLKQLQG